jgi:hypothetical protein
MMPSSLLDHTQRFRTAVEARDLSLAQQALEDFLSGFRSSSRTPSEVEDARNLFEWAIQEVTIQKTQIADQLMLLKRIIEVYRPPNSFHTWRVDG